MERGASAPPFTNWRSFKMEELKANLEKMSKKDLIEHANLTYGLALNANHQKHDIINAIERSQMRFRGNRELSIGANELKPGYSRIRMTAGELNPSGRPVIVGLNGKQFSIPVGVEVNIPNPLVEILENALRREYRQDPSTMELIMNEVPSYPFSVLARG
jgi:hypothetical protein